MKTVAVGAVAIVILAAAAYLWIWPAIGIVGGVHEHADFKVYLNGAAFNFSLEKYMSDRTGNRTLSSFAHLHDGNGNVIHVHARGVTLGAFFKSLGMNFTPSCFVTDFGTRFCTVDKPGPNKRTLRLYVNGVPNAEFDRYAIRDLDRILITHGNQGDAEIAAQIASVTADACIYSGKCPERGSPPPESS